MIKLDDAHKKFIKDLESQNKSSSTLLAYGKDIEQLSNHLSKRGVNLVSEIKLEDLQSFMDKLANDNYTPKSISRKTNSTKTFFKFLKAENHVDDNVADLLKHPKVESKAPRILSRLEYRALRDAARGDMRTYAMVEVLLQAGLTISELAGMKIEEISKLDTTDGSILSVPKRNNKEARLIPLNKAVLEALNKYLADGRPDVDGPHLFVTKTGKALLVRNIRSTIDKYFKLAGIEKAKVNDLRHTFVAHHLGSGVSIVEISRIAGHKRLSTTERYLEFIERPESQEKTELGVL